MTRPKAKTVNDLSRCLDPLDMDATLIAVVEMSQSSWLVGGIVPGVERQPLKKLAIDEHALLDLLNRWRAEAEKNGHRITRNAVAFEALGVEPIQARFSAQPTYPAPHICEATASEGTP